MNLDLLNRLDGLSPDRIAALSDAELVELTQDFFRVQAYDRQINQLRYYLPVSPKAIQIHCSLAKVLGVGGGNGASKTDSALVEMVIRATGQIPNSLKDVYPRQKLRGPINCRIVVESITNTLETISLPKLQWWKWQGVDEPGGPRGHYGWIPKHCLLLGEWDESWTARTRTLEVFYRDPDTDEPRGISRIQSMSYDRKCMPNNLEGLFVAAAMSVTDRPEVLVPRIVSFLQILSNWANTFFFSSKSSGTASSMRSQSLRCSIFMLVLIRLRILSFSV